MDLLLWSQHLGAKLGVDILKPTLGQQDLELIFGSEAGSSFGCPIRATHRTTPTWLIRLVRLVDVARQLAELCKERLPECKARAVVSPVSMGVKGKHGWRCLEVISFALPVPWTLGADGGSPTLAVFLRRRSLPNGAEVSFPLLWWVEKGTMGGLF